MKVEKIERNEEKNNGQYAINIFKSKQNKNRSNCFFINKMPIRIIFMSICLRIIVL